MKTWLIVVIVLIVVVAVGSSAAGLFLYLRQPSPNPKPNPNPPSPDPSKYKEVSTKKCEKPITTKDECQAAGLALLKPKNGVMNIRTGNFGPPGEPAMPAGCYFSNDKKTEVYLNTNTTTSDCGTLNTTCICEQ